MADDLQMARGNIEGGYNLAVGEPVVIQKHLKFPEFKYEGPLPYPTIDGLPALTEELKLIYPNKKIVVTNGAKQALLAAFYAMKKQGRKEVAHFTPYWPSYPTLAGMSGLNFCAKYNSLLLPDQIFCVTSPNNPDGLEAPLIGMRTVDIWDAVYAHSVYGFTGPAIPARATVAGAAKLMGLSGARIGWLVTEESSLAEEAAKYVEFTTSGVALLSQQYVADCLKYMRLVDCSEAYKKARQEMLTNGEMMNYYFGDMADISGLPEHGKGMFAWFHVSLHDIGRIYAALKKSKVALVTGEACGERSGMGYFRMSMGQTNDYTEQALKALKDAL